MAQLRGSLQTAIALFAVKASGSDSVPDWKSAEPESIDWNILNVRNAQAHRIQLDLWLRKPESPVGNDRIPPFPLIFNASSANINLNA
jgi:hypothetical protein